MSKVLDKSLGVISILLQISLVIVCFSFITPFVYLYYGFTGKMAQNGIVNSSASDFLISPDHIHVTHSQIANFPNIPYSILMAVGITLTVIAIIILFWAIVQIISNIGKKQYFVADNLRRLKNIVIAQIITVCADPFLAAGNQLSASKLGRINDGLFSATWETLGNDVINLVFFGVIYFLFKLAFNLKEESDLTV